MPAPTDDKPAAPAAAPAAAKKDTSHSKAKGTYFQHSVGSLVGVPVHVVDKRKVDGVEKFDLAREDSDEPFVKNCEARDKPEEGFFVPA